MTFCFRHSLLKFLAVCFAAASLLGQTQVDLHTQSKDVDFSTALLTRPAKLNAGQPATCSVGEMYFDTSAAAGTNVFACTSANTWTSVGRRIPSSTLANLPATCTVGDLYYVTDASFSGGGWNLFTCSAPNTFSQAGVQADGTGYITVTCAQPSTCLVGPNLSVLPTLVGPNMFVGSSDFSGASKTAMFRLAASAPATCDAGAHETYYDTVNNTINLCTSSNTWTAVATLGSSNAWVGANDFSGASKTAMFRLAASAPATCDATAHEAYYDTTTNSVNVCSSTNTWTPVNGTGASFLLYQNTNIPAVTANGATQTLDSFTIPAGKLRAGDIVEIEATFTRTGSAAAMTFGVTFGGTAMQDVSTPASSSSAFYKPSLNVASGSSEIWGGTVLVNGVSPVVVSSSTNPAASINSSITVSLTQKGTSPDTGTVASWYVKVTR